MSGNYPDGVNQQVFDEAHEYMDESPDHCHHGILADEDCEDCEEENGDY